jgi:hypothetical protein
MDKIEYLKNLDLDAELNRLQNKSKREQRRGLSPEEVLKYQENMTEAIELNKIINTSPFSPKKWSREDKKRMAQNLERFLKRSPDYVTYEERKRKITRANTKRIKPETYSPEFIKAIKNAEQEIKDGGGIIFKNIDEFKAYFKKMENKRKKGSHKAKAKRKTKGCGCK